MYRYLEGGIKVELSDVLGIREWRQNYQNNLENQFPKNVVVSVKLNIPGEVKNSQVLKKILLDGWMELKSQFEEQNEQLLFLRLILDRITGPEALAVLTGTIMEIKKQAINFEESFKLGRLFDVDVMSKDDKGYQLSRTQLGFEPRKCLVCNNNAKYCVKEQKHSIEEVQMAISSYIKKSEQREEIKFDLSQMAVSALLYEVVTTPKPGLVDPASSGSHQDMDVFTFIESAQALHPYFVAAQKIGNEFLGDNLSQMFNELRRVGVIAEKRMYLATNGINTHKGAIFSLGILVCATAYLQKNETFSRKELANTIIKMVRNLLEDDFQYLKQKPSEQLSAGEIQYLKYKKTGIRGEAVAGYPAVLKVGLPFLQKTTGSLNQRLVDTLMYIAANVSDSNLIKRAGTVEVVDEIKKWSKAYFKKGGSKTVAGINYLKELDQLFIQRNLSLGGSADLLILTVFLGKVEGII